MQATFDGTRGDSFATYRYLHTAATVPLLKRGIDHCLEVEYANSGTTRRYGLPVDESDPQDPVTRTPRISWSLQSLRGWSDVIRRY